MIEEQFKGDELALKKLIHERDQLDQEKADEKK
jgi:hypothetical protein